MHLAELPLADKCLWVPKRALRNGSHPALVQDMDFSGVLDGVCYDSAAQQACCSTGSADDNSSASGSGNSGQVVRQDELVANAVRAVCLCLGADAMGRCKLTKWQTPSANHNGSFCNCAKRGLTEVWSVLKTTSLGSVSYLFCCRVSCSMH
jgi:hypothetical protein